MQARPKCSSRQPRKSKIDDRRPGFSLLAKKYPVSTIEEQSTIRAAKRAFSIFLGRFPP